MSRRAAAAKARVPRPRRELPQGRADERGVSPKVFRRESAWIEGEKVLAGHTDELILTVARQK